jgi:hypothetical protein
MRLNDIRMTSSRVLIAASGKHPAECLCKDLWQIYPTRRHALAKLLGNEEGGLPFLDNRGIDTPNEEVSVVMVTEVR